MQVGIATLENSVEIPQEIKNRASLWPCNCTNGYLPHIYRCSEKKSHLYPNVYSSHGHGHQTVERTMMPFNGWMDKEDVVHIYYWVLCLHQKGWIPNFSINMDRTGRDYAQCNKSSRESQLSYGFTYLWSITNNMEDMGRWSGERSWGKLEGEGEPWETMDSEKQHEGFEGRAGGRLGEPGGGY